MPKPIHIRIDTPCRENWEHMPPTEQGAFCQACQKQVIDFTGKTQSEIYDIVSKAQGGMCGRFRASQIEEPIYKIEVKRSWLNWKAAATGLVAAFSFTRLSAGDNGVKPNVVTVETDAQKLSSLNNKSEEQKSSDAIHLKIKVVGALNGAPLGYARIYVNELGIRATADVNGYLELAIEKDKMKNVKVVFFKRWYYNKEVDLQHLVQRSMYSKKHLRVTLTHKPVKEHMVMGGFGF